MLRLPQLGQMKWGIPGKLRRGGEAFLKDAASRGRLSKEARGALRTLEPQVGEGGGGGHPSARRALEEAALEQVRLVHVLDRVGLLGDGDRERREPDRAALELLADRAQDVAVEPVEPGVVDLEQVERLLGHIAVDASGVPHLREVAHTLQQAVGHARRPARARGNRARTRTVDLHAEDARRAIHDESQVVGVVEVKAVRDPEAVAQRCREQAGPGGRSDQRELRKVERDHPRSRALADRDRQLAVLHRRIERLLERARQPVDLVDEEDAVLLERGEERRDVALALERRPRGLHERHVELVRHDLRERGLAEARRAREQHVVERLPSPPRRLDEHLELVLHRALADEVLEPPRPQRAIELVVVRVGGRGLDPLDAGRPDAAAHRAAFRAAAIRSSGASPSPPLLSSSSSASCAEKPSPTRPCLASTRGSSVLVTTISSGASATFSRSSTIIRSAVRLPMPGTAWKRAESPVAIAFRSSRVVPPLKTASATFGPTPCTPTSIRNSSRSSSVANP